MASKWPKELIIIRHGQSARNVAKDAAKKAGVKANYSEGVRDQDTPLTDYGFTQAEAVGRYLECTYPDTHELEDYDPESVPLYRGIDTFFISPYLRTRQTADRILHGLGYQPKKVIEERIREIEFGILDGLTPDGIKAKFPEEVERRKREGKYWYRAPGGESRPDVKDRLRSFLDTLVRDYSGTRVVVVCHSVVVLAFRALLERWEEDQYLAVDRENDVRNCSLTVYDGSCGKIRLVDYNKVVYPEQVLAE